jgi:hypothetical protein
MRRAPWVFSAAAAAAAAAHPTVLPQGVQVEEPPSRQQLNHVQRLARQLRTGAGGGGRGGRVEYWCRWHPNQPSLSSAVQRCHIGERAEPVERRSAWRPAAASLQQLAGAVAAHPQHQQQAPPQVRPLVPGKLYVITLDGVAVQQVPAVQINLLGRGGEIDAAMSQSQDSARKGPTGLPPIQYTISTPISTP